MNPAITCVNSRAFVLDGPLLPTVAFKKVAEFGVAVRCVGPGDIATQVRRLLSEPADDDQSG